MHGAPSGASFELTLSEPGSEDIVWKATLDTKGSSFGAGFYSSGTVGNAEATVWTCDFSYEYVKINAEYRT